MLLNEARDFELLFDPLARLCFCGLLAHELGDADGRGSLRRQILE